MWRARMGFEGGLWRECGNGTGKSMEKTGVRSAREGYVVAVGLVEDWLVQEFWYGKPITAAPQGLPFG